MWKRKKNNHRTTEKTVGLLFGIVCLGLVAIWAATPQTAATQAFVTFYVDSQNGDDAYSCAESQDPDTPKRSVASALQCNPGAGETVRFRGIFTETINPPRSGEVLYDVQDIPNVRGSIVEFSFEPRDLEPAVDYVLVYGSRKGNSGAFPVVAVADTGVKVDTSDLPGGQFISEDAADPGDLQAAIIRPVHYTAWDETDPPSWQTSAQTFRSADQHAVMLSHIHSDSLREESDILVWPAVEIDGTPGGNADFHVFDHLDIEHADAGIATEFNDFHSNYTIIQHSRLHDIGYPGGASEEIIYWGNAYHPERHHDYCQIMYNQIGPHNDYPVSTDPEDLFAGDGLEIKPSAHSCTVFGNEIVGTQAILGCDDAPMRIGGTNTFVANNYVHDINPRPDDAKGCGISIVDRPDLGENGGGEGSIVVNNVIANVKQVGIRVIDTSNVQILNNVIFNVFPAPGCKFCLEETAGIMIYSYADATENIVIQNNIVHTSLTGIGRYQWSEDHPFSITSSHNIVFGTVLPFGRDIPQTATDQLIDPGLIDPSSGNFAIGPDSSAKDTGINRADVFMLDHHSVAAAGFSSLSPPIARAGNWDIGSYEIEDTAGPQDEPGYTLVLLGAGLLVTVSLLLVMVVYRRDHHK